MNIIESEEAIKRMEINESKLRKKEEVVFGEIKIKSSEENRGRIRESLPMMILMILLLRCLRK